MCLFPPWINYFVGNIQCKTHPQFLLKEAVFSDDFYFNFVLWASNLVQHAYLTCMFYNSVLSKDTSCPCNHRTVLHVWIVHLSATLIPWEWDVILIILSLCSNILGTWLTYEKYLHLSHLIDDPYKLWLQNLTSCEGSFQIFFPSQEENYFW